MRQFPVRGHEVGQQTSGHRVKGTWLPMTPRVHNTCAVNVIHVRSYKPSSFRGPAPLWAPRKEIKMVMRVVRLVQVQEDETKVDFVAFLVMTSHV